MSWMSVRTHSLRSEPTTVRCRARQLFCVVGAPGLGLQMFPHQRAAVRWMLRRELPARLPPPPHPHIRHLRTRCGLTYSASLATGKVTDAPPPQVRAYPTPHCFPPSVGMQCDHRAEACVGLQLRREVQSLTPAPSPVHSQPSPGGCQSMFGNLNEIPKE